LLVQTSNEGTSFTFCPIPRIISCKNAKERKVAKTIQHLPLTLKGFAPLPFYLSAFA